MSLSAEEILAGWQNDNIGTERVLATDDMTIWHLRLDPGATIAAHRHNCPYFWTVLTDGTGLSRFDDGREVAITYQAGDTQHFPDLTPETGFVHDLTNNGNTPLAFVTVEFNSAFDPSLSLKPT
ncbi:cupin domain-containing protein [Kiloniella majae]|uniref:cupin domain-containing protein n=1 Tax=Kiloniella majae TaxID=1938558 RepID=UPI000A278589|nr:cupin domain-containing protein [Kiloniella majae]